ncbi:MAG: hypothetical protein RR287_06940 [Oscillospiraceae bacterium]
MKTKDFEIFTRNFIISLLVLMAPMMIFAGCCAGYEAISAVSTGTKMAAVELMPNGSLRVLDMVIPADCISWFQYLYAAASSLVASPVRLIYLVIKGLIN